MRFFECSQSHYSFSDNRFGSKISTASNDESSTLNLKLSMAPKSDSKSPHKINLWFTVSKSNIFNRKPSSDWPEILVKLLGTSLCGFSEILKKTVLQDHHASREFWPRIILYNLWLRFYAICFRYCTPSRDLCSTSWRQLEVILKVPIRNHKNQYSDYNNKNIGNLYRFKSWAKKVFFKRPVLLDFRDLLPLVGPISH